MKIFLLFALLLCAALLSSQCKQTRYTADNLPEKRLSFGDGGGFTGLETTFILFENGQIFKMTSKAPDLNEVTGTQGKTAKKLFETAVSLGVPGLDFLHPGNLYQFVEYQDGDQKRRIVWGDSEHPVDPKIKSLYDDLKALVVEQK